MKKAKIILSSLLLTVSCSLLIVFAAGASDSTDVKEYTDVSVIKAVQQALNEAGYDCGTADGISGSKTVDAINRYEKGNGLTVNGIITDELLESLEISYEDADVADIEISQEETETEFPRDDGQITFRNIPWGTSYTEVDSILSDLGMWDLSGESFKTYSIDDIILGDYKGLTFKNTDINIIGETLYSNIDVAGYTTSDICLYFAYIPVDGVLTKTKDDSALYGAQYVFEPIDLEGMALDMTEKLTSIYGDPEDTDSDRDLWGVKSEYTFWYGENDTALVMRTEDCTDDVTGLYDDTLYLSYVWLKGDELLQEASDILGQNNKDAEAEVFGNNSTNGL